MPSPFPGMDPYLESQPFWSDLHGSMLSAIKAQLQERLPRKYSVWSDTYVWLHEPDFETRRSKPDNFVTAHRHTRKNGGTVTLPAPATSILPAVRREGNRYLKIKEVDNERVITVLEFLSPTNKVAGADRDAFLAKRNEYLATKTNVVEIDLLREGNRLPMGEPAPPAADYYVLICRAADFPKTAIWPLSVRDRLPDLPIPLKPEDGVVTLYLKDCFDLAYDQGPYRKVINYTKPPRIPLIGADATWAEELLAKSPTSPTMGRRRRKNNPGAGKP
jgi:uncharacterized protein DUF4058